MEKWGKKLGKEESINIELIISICFERKKFQTTQPTHLMVNGEWRMYLGLDEEIGKK